MKYAQYAHVRPVKYCMRSYGRFGVFVTAHRVALELLVFLEILMHFCTYT
jgi:hypothetical protein